MQNSSGHGIAGRGRFSSRALLAADQALLWDIFHIALWDPPPAPLRPREVLSQPQIRIFAENWGQASDVGVVGLLDDAHGEQHAIGACWMRLLPTGLGYIDATTPQLGIALLPAFQHQGWGQVLMQAGLDAARAAGYQQVALTVHPENPARGMYARCGFVDVGLRNHYHLMLATLT